MNRKAFFIILSVVCLLAAVGVVVFGTIRTNKPVEVEDVGLLTLRLDEKDGDIALRRQGKTLKEIDEDGDGEYTLFFKFEHPKYGEIKFSRSVDSVELNDINLRLERMEQAQIEAGEGPDGADTYDIDTAIKTVDKYVYAYPTYDGYDFRFYDSHLTTERVAAMIDDTPKVSNTIYYFVAAILLLGGAYLLFLAFAGGRAKENEA